MIEISLNKINKNYGFKNILNDVSFEIKTNDTIGLIGENGCGKSTILKLINKEENPTEGTISIKKGSTIGYLPQIPIVENDNKTVKEYLYENLQNIIDIGNKIKKHEEQMSNCSQKELQKIIQKYCNLQEKYNDLGGYEIDSKIDKIVAGFKINKLLNKTIKNLSGGEKRIVYLAQLMINNPNILLLDEPTNHLDIETLEWFENYLKKYDGTILIVSHDRYFLDKVTTKTILIENGNNYIFNGNYSYYLKENELRIEKEFKDYKDQQKMIIAMKNKIKKLEEFGRLAFPQGEKFFKRAQSIRKRLEKVEVLNKPIIKKEIPLNFDFDTRSGKKVLSIKDYNLSIDNKILINNINFEINYKDKVCIIGSNGCGKSALIKQIINKDNNIDIGNNVNIGYIPQEILFSDNITILDYCKKFYIGDESHLRSALNKFYFHGPNVFKKVNNLSGGEKVRLKLFELIQNNNNFLILDEPTNHIDIYTKEILEEALNDYNGTVLFISHDRYFINKLANKTLYINNNKLTEYIGNYDYLITHRKSD